MNFPILSPRLQKIAELVPCCNCVADIGTDHGYIPIFSVLSKKAKLAVASDINPGPVSRAAENVKIYGVEDRVSLRLGKGLKSITPGEADVIVIAGMGGILISNILEASKETVKVSKLLILQPMTAQAELRSYLCENGFSPQNEYLVAEDNKIYNIITAAFGEGIRYSKEELIFGKGLDKTSPLLYDAHRASIVKKLHKQLTGLKSSVLEENKEKAKQLDDFLKNL